MKALITTKHCAWILALVIGSQSAMATKPVVSMHTDDFAFPEALIAAEQAQTEPTSSDVEAIDESLAQKNQAPGRRLLLFSRTSNRAIVINGDQQDTIAFEVCSLPPFSESKAITAENVGQCVAIAKKNTVHKQHFAYFMSHYSSLLETEWTKLNGERAWSNLFYYLDAIWLSSLAAAGGMAMNVHANQLATRIGKAGIWSGAISFAFYLYKVYAFFDEGSTTGQQARDLEAMLAAAKSRPGSSAEIDTAKSMEIIIKTLNTALQQYQKDNPGLL